ncbi:hypothetical protein IC617_04390 [Neiella sp. HB171785]|uniref:Pectate lyase superfamily protein domain-containing protein n=1 Tax=Neiella litorisoli TaxID=2771431 RepID=A0A8J6R270_9GAMM|nr:glycosyl hydrolase family 28-related protein [Neiella litorisoli]MBD1388660.1 hypothetical protein [Neiella litorisoli]
MKLNVTLRSLLMAAVCTSVGLPAMAKEPGALSNIYLPDFSYAGYEYGEKQPDTKGWKVIHVNDHGLLPNDNEDDTVALLALLDSLKKQSQPVIVQFGKGRYILSEIIRIQRSNIVLRGSGQSTTELYFPRPLELVKFPEELRELSEYLVKQNKYERRPKDNMHMLFSNWSWSGGFLWTGVEGERIKSYLKEYDRKVKPLAKLTSGGKDDFTFTVDSAKQLKVGDIVRINWYNREGKGGSLIPELYGDPTDIEIGSHHWNFPDMALIRQHTKITGISGNKVTIKTPLLHAADPRWQPDITEWKHISNVGFEHFTINFPIHPWVAHHVEPGFNGMFLTRTHNGWVKDITIHNADSGILTENAANLTIENVTTTAHEENALAHYSVQTGGVSLVLVKNLTVANPMWHSISANTFGNKNVYVNSRILVDPYIDQHGGANHENLFDNTEAYITLDEDLADQQGYYSYPLFTAGGAPYWRPQHGKYNTLWNTKLYFSNGAGSDKPVVIDGMKSTSEGRIIGLSGNLPIKLKYNDITYKELINGEVTGVPSLYHYQLNKRLKN